MRLTRTWPLVAAALLLVASLALYWPGYALYDTINQYDQVLSGEYEDWHPPAMARLWSLLHAWVGGAAGPMLALQLALYWLGIGLIARGVAGAGWRGAAITVLAIGLCPLFLGWQAAVLKDAQMVGALLAATGLIVERRLSGHTIGRLRWTAIIILVGYATLVRSNAVFASVPLLLLTLARPALRWRLAAVPICIVAVLGAMPMINHRLLGASPSGVETTQPIYDLAGIVHFGGVDALPPDEAAVVSAKNCWSPFFWDRLGDRCDDDMQPLRDAPRSTLIKLWLTGVLHHPLLYLQHRLAHLNSTDRWLVPANWPAAEPPRTSQSNTLGLGMPGRLADAVGAVGGALVRTPVGWPAIYDALGLVALLMAIRLPSSPATRVAVALLGSALTLEASFAVISIASDLRYHLWPMIAVSLGLVLLVDRRPGRRALTVAGMAVAVVLAAAVAARLVLPPGPPTYGAMLA